MYNTIKINAIAFLILGLFSLFGCHTDNEPFAESEVSTTFQFSHHWDDEAVTNFNFNNFQYTNAHGELLSIVRLRYVISDITFTRSNGETITIDGHHLVDVTNANGLVYAPEIKIPKGDYTDVSFTFGLDNEDNSKTHLDLNSASFDVPEQMGGGYHFMQFDGKFIDHLEQVSPFNYHAIRAVDNSGTVPTFPQDTFFEVSLGAVSISNNTQFQIDMNIAEWFRNPNIWNLNELSINLMPNAAAQIMMHQNGQSVFSLASTTQQ